MRVVCGLLLLLSACGSGEPMDGGPDPLGLAGCEGEAPLWSNGVSLPPLGWGSATPLDDFSCGLRALDTELDGARVLCSGELDHGTSEATRVHALLARWVVHRHGVRTIAIEATEASGEAWGRYVATGDRAALDRGFEDFAGSLAETLEWERFLDALADVASELPDGETLELTGFDIAVQPGLTRRSLLSYVESVAPAELMNWTTRLSAGNPDAAASDADALIAQLDANRDAYVATTGEGLFTRARRDAENLRDGFRFLSLRDAGDFATGNGTYREGGMHRNVLVMLDGLAADESLLLVGHNNHCAKDWTIGTDETGAPAPSLGARLVGDLGASYTAIAQAYGNGERNVFDVSGVRPEPFEAGASTLSAAVALGFLEEQLTVSTATSTVDLTVPYPTVFEASPRVPADQYDGLVFVLEVSAATPR